MPAREEEGLPTANETEWQSKWAPAEVMTVHPDDNKLTWRLPTVKMYELRSWSGRKKKWTMLYYFWEAVERLIGRTRASRGGIANHSAWSCKGRRTSPSVSPDPQSVQPQRNCHVNSGPWALMVCPVASSGVTNGALWGDSNEQGALRDISVPCPQLAVNLKLL